MSAKLEKMSTEKMNDAVEFISIRTFNTIDESMRKWLRKNDSPVLHYSEAIDIIGNMLANVIPNLIVKIIQTQITSPDINMDEVKNHYERIQNFIIEILKQSNTPTQFYNDIQQKTKELINEH